MKICTQCLLAQFLLHRAWRRRLSFYICHKYSYCHFFYKHTQALQKWAQNRLTACQHEEIFSCLDSSFKELLKQVGLCGTYGSADAQFTLGNVKHLCSHLPFFFFSELGFVHHYTCSTSSGSLVCDSSPVYLSSGWNKQSLKPSYYCMSPWHERFCFGFDSFIFSPLVSRVHTGALNEKDLISREDHELETEKLELEIQHCKEMIKTQQQLLQVVDFNYSYFFSMESKIFILMCHSSHLWAFLHSWIMLLK